MLSSRLPAFKICNRKVLIKRGRTSKTPENKAPEAINLDCGFHFFFNFRTKQTPLTNVCLGGSDFSEIISVLHRNLSEADLGLLNQFQGWFRVKALNFFRVHLQKNAVQLGISHVLEYYSSSTTRIKHQRIAHCGSCNSPV